MPPEIDGQNPQISPDGRLILFSSRVGSESYNLHVMKSDGTDRIQLTDLGLDSPGARFSPNGTKIAFSRYDNSQPGVFTFNIFTINIDGSELTQLTAGIGRKENPVFSPDGSKILFTSSVDIGKGFSSYELFTVNTDGTNETRLTNTPVFQNVYNQAYTADGSKIVFSTWCGGGCGGTSFVIETMNSDGTGRTVLTNPTVSSHNPRLNTTGTKIVFVGNAGTDFLEIYSMNLDGSEITNLSASAENEFFPFYTADGESIIFQRAGNMMKMDANGMNVVQLRDDYLTTNSNVATSGLIDSDGDGIANPCDNCPNNANPFRVVFDTYLDVWSMWGDGTGLTRLTNNATSVIDIEASFNAAGTKILFTSNRFNNRQELYTMDPDGSNVTRLTNIAGGNSSSSFNHDGSKIVFISRRSNNRENLYVMNADGTDQRRLTNTDENEVEPTFTPDGRNIAFINANDNKIYIMNIDGTNIRRLSSNPSVNLYENKPSFAPQTDSDGDGIGDACDEMFDVNTPAGDNVAVAAPSANVAFSSVSQAGVTSFTPITPDQEQMPQGYTLCPECQAYEITTTAVYTPPIEVCLDVPGTVPAQTFLTLQLLHGENGVFVDRTTRRFDDGLGYRSVCGSVDSLSPFALAEYLAPSSSNVAISGRVTNSIGYGIRNARLTLTALDGTRRTVSSSAFGYYSFKDVQSGRTYVLEIASKTHSFSNPTRTFVLNDAISGMDFVELPNLTKPAFNSSKADVLLSAYMLR
ncbi:MAG: PD40 domain-containing protein [Acidobacteria bacterium]|nr:PD40 domain-containing protein [Acidobacteriota bacterium]